MNNSSTDNKTHSIHLLIPDTNDRYQCVFPLESRQNLFRDVLLLVFPRRILMVTWTNDGESADCMVELCPLV